MDPVNAEADSSAPLVSIVIPVLGDWAALATTLASLDVNTGVEVIVVSGGRKDVAATALEAGAPYVQWLSSSPGRGRQMNAGALQARGRWLVFLHADTRLPDGWLADVARANDDASVVGGSFRFALDSTSRWARVVEAGVAARVAWLNLPYGDQALFVRRDVFRALGGYREMALMEDVDLVRRLRRMGRLHHVARPAVTSARRWERDGWFRRSAENVVLVLLFFAGVPPERLARRYRRDRAAVAIMARAPSDTRGKSRLLHELRADDGLELRRALLLDTIDSARSVRGVDTILLFTPDTAGDEFAALGARVTRLAPQRGEGLGARLEHAFADLFAAGYSAVTIIGSDLPTLPAAYIARGVAALLRHPDPLVLGPADDGGYYLVGLRSSHPEIFRGIPWGTTRVLAETRAAADAHGLPVALLPAWYDVDTVDDLRRAIASPDREAHAPRYTREWANGLDAIENG